MSSSRILPNSNIGRLLAINAAEARKEAVPVGGNVLSAVTTARLLADKTGYNTAMGGVTTAEAALNVASVDAVYDRIMGRLFINGYFNTINNAIAMGLMLNTVRVLFGLDSSNSRLPDISTDDKLVLWGQKIIDGDAARVLAGGAAMAYPTMAEFTPVYAAAVTSINNVNNKKMSLTNAQTAVNLLNPEIDKVIVRIWDEVETAFSDLETSAMRTAARLWGVKYPSRGLPAIVNCHCTNSTTGANLGDVSVHIEGSNSVGLSDLITGLFPIHTTRNGDLVLIAVLPGFISMAIPFTLADGGTPTIEVVMVPE